MKSIIILLLLSLTVSVCSQTYDYDNQATIYSNPEKNVGIDTDIPTKKLDVNGSIIAKGGFFEAVNIGTVINATIYEEYLINCKSLTAGEILATDAFGDKIRRFNYYDLITNSNLSIQNGSYFNIRDEAVSRFVFYASDEGDSRLFLSNKNGEEFLKIFYS